MRIIQSIIQSVRRWVPDLLVLGSAWGGLFRIDVIKHYSPLPFLLTLIVVVALAAVLLIIGDWGEKIQECLPDIFALFLYAGLAASIYFDFDRALQGAIALLLSLVVIFNDSDLRIARTK